MHIRFRTDICIFKLCVVYFFNALMQMICSRDCCARASTVLQRFDTGAFVVVTTKSMCIH